MPNTRFQDLDSLEAFVPKKNLGHVLCNNWSATSAHSTGLCYGEYALSCCCGETGLHNAVRTVNNHLTPNPILTFSVLCLAVQRKIKQPCWVTRVLTTRVSLSGPLSAFHNIFLPKVSPTNLTFYLLFFFCLSNNKQKKLSFKKSVIAGAQGPAALCASERKES